MSNILQQQHILFITSSRIGDAVLSFGILGLILDRYPSAKFTIVCGPLVVSLLEGFPNIHRLISLKKQKYSKHWLDLWLGIKATRFDLVVDLRNSLVSRIVLARSRFIFGPHIDTARHKVEQNAQVIGSMLAAGEIAPPPRLWISAAQKQKAAALIPYGAPVIGVGPTANWAGKTWPVERFIEVIAGMTQEGGLMPFARVAVFAAPGEEACARRLLASLPPVRALDLIAKTDPGTAAAALERCAYYLGNDSGLMHCAAAAGVPAMGLFGPSYPEIYRPWGAHCAYCATPEPFDALINFKGYDAKTVGTLMASLTVENVRSAISLHWQTVRKP